MGILTIFFVSFCLFELNIDAFLVLRRYLEKYITVIIWVCIVF